MKRKTLARWFQACLVGSVVAGGCNRQEVPVARNESDLLTPVGAWAQRDQKSPTAMKRGDGALIPTGYSMPEKSEIVQAMETSAAADLPPVVVADPPAAPGAATPAPTMPNPLSAETMAAALPVSFEVPKPNLKRTAVEPTKLESVDARTTGMGRYGHAADYSWVCGEVQHTRKGWRLRYASVDETDAYGGSVTLSDDPRLTQLKEGEIYTVEGRLQNPESRFSAPTYVVSDVKPQRQ